MAKRLITFSFRLLFLNLVAFLLGIIVMVPLLGVWDSVWFKWFLSLLFSFLWFMFIWLDTVGFAQKNIQKDKIIARKIAEEQYVPQGDEGKNYAPWHGFLIGLLSQIPSLIVIVISFFHGLQEWPTLVLRGWYIIFFQSYVTFEGALPYLFLVYPIILACVSGLAYLNGSVQQRRLETIIERNKARKAKRVQDDLKNSKKHPPKKPGARG